MNISIAILTISQGFQLPMYTKFICVYIWCMWMPHRRIIISPSVLTAASFSFTISATSCFIIEPVQHASPWCAQATAQKYRYIHNIVSPGHWSRGGVLFSIFYQHYSFITGTPWLRYRDLRFTGVTPISLCSFRHM